MLQPVWRCEPNHGSGVFTIALDPEEAEVVLGRGWATLDGLHYTVSLKGCHGNIDSDGRIMVRCEINDRENASQLIEAAESFRKVAYHE